jgi:hypothetical protein
MRNSPLSLRLATGCVTFVLAALAVDTVMAQDVELDATCAPLLTHQQWRLYEKANAGTDALRQFVFIRRAILQVDVYETATWAESLNAARAVCSVRRSEASNVQAAIPVALSVPSSDLRRLALH